MNEETEEPELMEYVGSGPGSSRTIVIYAKDKNGRVHQFTANKKKLKQQWDESEKSRQHN